MTLQGGGGFSTVFNCTNSKTQRELSMKVISKLRPDIDCNELKREAELMGKLIHLNIVWFFDIFKDANDFYIILVYLEEKFTTIA